MAINYDVEYPKLQRRIAELNAEKASLTNLLGEYNEQIVKLQAAIKIHLREEGFSDKPETVKWWIEQHQPYDIQTTTTGVKDDA